MRGRELVELLLRTLHTEGGAVHAVLGEADADERVEGVEDLTGSGTAGLRQQGELEHGCIVVVHDLDVADRGTEIVNGSGIDLDYFTPAPLPGRSSFLMIARLLKDKGIREFASAAKRLKADHRRRARPLA